MPCVAAAILKAFLKSGDTRKFRATTRSDPGFAPRVGVSLPAGALAALGRTRGRKTKFTPEQKRLAALQGENTRLKRELEQAHTIIEVQKKLCTLLGLPTAASPESTGSES